MYVVIRNAFAGLIVDMVTFVEDAVAAMLPLCTFLIIEFPAKAANLASLDASLDPIIEWLLPS